VRFLGILAVGVALVSLSPDARADDIKLKSGDGERVHAVHQAVADSTKGVVLVHMEGRSARDFRFLAERLNRSGFHTVAVDLRGHGANVPEGEEAPPIETAEDWFAARGEIAAAVAFLRKKGVTDISLLGASVGANLVAHVAARDAEITNLILLSPGINIQGVTVADAVKTYGDRPLLIAVSEEDRYSAKSALVLNSDARGSHHLEVYRSAGHGTIMLTKAPGLEPLVLSWLLGTHGGVDISRKKIAVDGDTEQKEGATGEYLGTHQ
jgi:pimeloyl-ACP methyl ester carboxylesterase